MNDIKELRTHLFETLRGLKNKDEPMEIERAKAVSEVAKTLIDSARVEVDFLRATCSSTGTGFIAIEGDVAVKPGGVQVLQDDRNGKTTVEERDGMRITRHVAR